VLRRELCGREETIVEEFRLDGEEAEVNSRESLLHVGASSSSPCFEVLSSGMASDSTCGVRSS
jgi:hypothetical protein